MAADDSPGDGALPISWDEAREVVIVVTTAAAALILLGPVVGFFDGRYTWSFGDDVAEVTRNASPTAGLLILVAGLVVATTPPTDVVPVLRRSVAIVALLIAIFGVAAVTVELTRPSAVGVAGRLQSVMGRSGPGAMLAATARWLALRVVPFDDSAS